MTLNIGPQHPATHGTLRIVAKLDGEQVLWAEPIMGYMHRGYEKLVEVRTYPQVTTLVNRIDWLGSFANEVPFILACEQLMEVEAPPRAQYIRTILHEMGRIAHLVMFLGDMGVQIGALTPMFYAFRDREYLLNQIEGATGGRFHPNFDRIGGVKDDFPAGWIAETNRIMKKMARLLRQMDDLLLGNEIFERPHPRRRRDPGRAGPALRPVRRQPARLGRRLGPAPRRRRRPWRGSTPTSRSITHTDGDSFARTWVPPPGDPRGDQDRHAAPRRPALGSDHGQGAPHHQGAGRRGLRRHREPAGRDGLLRHLQGRPRTVPGQDPHRQLLQRVDRPVAAPGRLRARHHHDPRLASTSSSETSTDEHLATSHRLAYWQQSILRSVGVLAAVLLPAGAFVYVFLFKMVSFMQNRLGPMEAGPYGSMQLLAEVGKSLQKEDIVPDRADKTLFKMAPYLVVATVLLTYVAVPFGPDMVFIDNRVFGTGIFYVMAVSSISVIGIILAGWASASKYSLLGGLRAAGQLIAYELPLVLSVVGVVIQAGTLDLQRIVDRPGQGRDLRLRRPRQPLHPHPGRRRWSSS